jgi:hypothetical protein
MGAIIEATPHRLRVGSMVVGRLCVLVPQIFVDTWFAVAIDHAFGMGTKRWSPTYLPELTRDDVIPQSEYTQSFTVISFGSMVLYLGGVVGVATL